MVRNVGVIRGVLGLTLTLMAGSFGVAGPLDGELVVETVAAGSALAAAGLQPGDTLQRWESTPRQASPDAAKIEVTGPLVTPFDWLRLRSEHAPRGPIELIGTRGGGAQRWRVAVGVWDATVRPPLAVKAAERHAEARALATAGKPAEAAPVWEALARETGDPPPTRAWLELQAAGAWADARSWPEARAALDRALATTSGDVWERTVVLHALARTLERQNDLARADAAYGEAAAAREALYGESLALAESLNQQGMVVRKRGDLDRAQSCFSRALQIQERLAPQSLEAALSLNNLGVVAFWRGDLPTAEGYYRRSLALRERLAPDSLELAASYNNLGNIANDRGQIAEAEALHRRALAIREKLVPDGIEVGWSLNNLGNAAFNRGDMAAAEAAYTRSLAIKERLQPGGPDIAMTLRNVGMVQSVRGNLDGAAVTFFRALEIYSRLAPGSVEEAMCLYDLGTLAVNHGDYAGAVELLGKALAIQEKLAPDSYDVAATELNLGEAIRLQKDLPGAERHFEHALAIREKLAPGGLDVSFALVSLSELARQRGDLDRAESLSLRALAIRERMAPQSYDTARTLHELGLVARARARTPQAADFFRRAVTVIEAQLQQLGGTREEQADFRARYLDYYRDAIDALVELGRSDEALGVMESSRARLLLAMLAERDLVLASDAPGDLDRERAVLSRELHRLQGELLRPGGEREPADVARLQDRLRQVRERQQQLREELTRQAPRLAALRYPEPLDAAGVRRSLDPGTVLVAFSTGRERSVVFVVTREGVSATPLAIGVADLADQVRAFRNLLQRAPGSVSDETLHERAQRLYDLVLRPVEHQLATATRLVLVPDGPLHLLPFGALVRATSAVDPPQYLAEWKPLSVTLSATLLAELGRHRPSAGDDGQPGPLVAFGDPVVSGPSIEGPGAQPTRQALLETLRRQGMELGPLPATRREVASLGRMWGDRATVLVGDAATEDQVMTLGRRPRFVHFACHGLVDERSPLDSSLLLSPPTHARETQSNGILQAWEVFEGVRLDAELVVLSACDTALGRELDGEGLIGLTRAFQYAGARAVVASLWSVADDTTAALMTTLYEGLRAGLPKDRALQAAQQALLHRKVPSIDPNGAAVEVDAANPFFWAAFQLYGDGR
jgi:CHAT domain-containing protein/Tfp pilus assembly protein PilF